MNVFDLDRSVLETYRRFARSFADIQAQDVKRKIDVVYERGDFWPDPLIQLNPSFKEGETVAKLVEAGDLAPGCEPIFRDARERDGSLRLWRHQVEAIQQSTGSFVVTTGTGSGKSLCYFIPIIDRILRARAVGEPRRARAIVIYPMNALANSQLKELEKRIPQERMKEQASYARLTGEDDAVHRLLISDEPPEILLTNFLMLEMLLTRQNERDRKIIENCQGLEFRAKCRPFT